MGSLVFLALLLGVMYFILIRPQQRQVKEQQARIRSLEAGMIVVTNSGIHGAIAEVEDKVIWLEVAPEVELKISKGAVAEIITDDDEDENDDESADDLAADDADA
ncbi:MAG: preprotein translocase subunit YajC [Acidimicrobiaceae bacterium]|jgi:preprotein translocase subunit YajC|nr:preprotein translocase subunit YajC [Acidimicrobiia bacterium]NDH88487.1 preprotein translocase subunit YajC [Actinomycetota bacterium]